jgi:hypothetical protein
MPSAPTELGAELARAAEGLRRLKRPFALVGGLAVSIRSEVRFTRDIDIAVGVSSDADAERLAADLAAGGYEIATIVEHEERKCLAIVRLRTRARLHVDLLVASSGIEPEIAEAATAVDLGEAGELPVAVAEDLLATKILSMSERRPQDQIDAANLLTMNPELDLDATRARLRLIEERGFNRGRDLESRLSNLLAHR